MNIEVFLTSNILVEDDVKDRTVIVIDVLRACSTIITALVNGARSIIPVADLGQASKIASNLDQQSYLLGGERDGDKIEGYHLGNSPFEYTEDRVKGRTIIMNTTNGTHAITQARSAGHLVIGTFINAQSVVDFVHKKGLDVTIICAGWHNRVSLEDTLCAGLLIDRIWEGKEPGLVPDTAHIAFSQYQNDKHALDLSVQRCNHAQLLKKKGYETDVEYCLRIDSLLVLPYYIDNQIILYNESKPGSAHGSAVPLRHGNIER